MTQRQLRRVAAIQQPVDPAKQRTELLAVLGKRNPNFLKVLVTTEKTFSGLLCELKEKMGGKPNHALRQITKMLSCEGKEHLRISVIVDNTTGKVLAIGAKIGVMKIEPIPTEYLRKVFNYYSKELSNLSSHP